MTLTTRRIFLTVLTLHVFLFLIRPVDDPDIWWHLKTGQHLVRGLSIPRVDIYSYTASGHQWIAHEWLSESLMYIVYSGAGWIGLTILFSLIATGVFLFLAIYTQAPAQIVLAVTVVAQFAALGALRNPRPRLATFAFTAVAFVMLRRYVQGDTRRLWLLPVLMIFWVNLHAGFPLGLIFILLAAASLFIEQEASRARHLIAIFSLCLVAVMVNPNGPKMFAYPFVTQFSSVQASMITEWNAPDFHARAAVPLLVLILMMIGALGLSRKRAGWFDLLSLMFAAFISLRSFRHVSVLSVVSIPILAEHSWDWLATTTYGRAIKDQTIARNKFTPALLILMIVIVHMPAIWQTMRSPVDLAQEPVRATRFLEENRLPDNVFSTYEWNDYLIWNAPSRKVFIDGRADMYGDEFLAAYVRLYDYGENWETTFDRFGVRTAMIESSSPLTTRMRNSADWSEVYRDDQATIFARK